MLLDVEGFGLCGVEEEKVVTAEYRARDLKLVKQGGFVRAVRLTGLQQREGQERHTYIGRNGAEMAVTEGDIQKYRERERKQGDRETYRDGETEERPRMRGKHKQAVEGAGEPQREGSRR